MGRSLVVDWKHTRKRLFILYRREPEVGYRTRLQAWMLLRQNKSVEEVAATVGVAYRTVQRWVAWYRQGGLAAVAQRRAPAVNPGARSGLEDPSSGGGTPVYSRRGHLGRGPRRDLHLLGDAVGV